MIFCSTSPSMRKNWVTTGEVVGPGRPGQHAGAVGGQRVGRRSRVVLDDLPGRSCRPAIPGRSAR